MKRNGATPSWARAAVVALLAAFAIQAWAAARADSVTIDEFGHLPAGLYAIFTGDFSLDPIATPHTRMLAALPLLRNPPAFAPDPRIGAWGMGYHLMERNAPRYHDIYLPARAVIIALAVLLGALVTHWAHELYGWRAALVAAFLFAFSPSMLAHGHLVTLDLSGALGFTATAYATWRLLDRRTVGAAIAAGVVLGVASLLKLSGFVLLAALVPTLAVRAWSERGRAAAVWPALFAVVGVTALVVINAGYLFSGTFADLERASLASGGMLDRVRAAAPWMRLPLPLPFVEGIDMVLNVGKEREPSYFLAGELSSGGWWYYHLAAFALKTSLPVLCLGLGAAVHFFVRGGLGPREYAVWIPIFVIFAFNSLFNSLQIGVRHVLPVYPLLFVAIAPRVAEMLSGWSRSAARAALTAGAVLLLTWHAVGTLAVAPRYLQFFNEIAGGPEGGHRWLIDSNVDWGQDLLRLREYMTRERIEGVHLAYFGRVHPAVYGIRFAPLERNATGIAVVSATFLMGRPYFWFLGGRMRWVPHDTYAWLRERKPIARVGSMFVYNLGP